MVYDLVGLVLAPLKLNDNLDLMAVVEGEEGLGVEVEGRGDFRDSLQQDPEAVLVAEGDMKWERVVVAVGGPPVHSAQDSGVCCCD